MQVLGRSLDCQPMPAVTVIMAFHRLTPFLRPAVRSILNQTLRDFEFLIVDNGTGAGLAALGDEGRDPRVQLIPCATNLGVVTAHNAARAQAHGEFIANMDSDDLALPTRLERQLAVLRAEPRLGLLSTHALVINEAGEVLKPQFTLAGERDQHVFSSYSLPVTNPTMMGRRAVFGQFPMRDQFVISSDYDFFARVIEVHPCRALPEVLLHYRRHAGQMTVNQFPTMVLYACMVRLITARRRAGRPEGLAELLGSMGDWLARPPPPSASYAFFAGRALAEDFPLLAVFLARRCVSLQRTAPALANAVRVLAAAAGREPGRVGSLLRMFFTGPLRTHGLRPV